MYVLEKKIIVNRLTNNIKYGEAKAQAIYDNPEIAMKIPSIKRSQTTKTYSSAARSTPVVPGIENLLSQQQEFFTKQQQQINYIQQQVVALINLVMADRNNDEEISRVIPKLTTDKRNLSEVSQSSSEDEEENPSKVRASSSRQEEHPTVSGVASSGEAMEEEFEDVIHRRPFGRLSGSPRSSISKETMETPPSDVVTTEGALGGRERSNRLSAHTRDPSVPPPGRQVKGGVEAGSSVPKGNKGGDVSKFNKKKINKITGPEDRPRWN